MKKMYARFQMKKLNEKMRIFFVVAVAIMMIIILIVTTASSVSALYEKSAEQQKSQVYFTSRSYEEWLSRQKDLAEALELDTSVQNYCTQSESSSVSYHEQYIDTKGVLNSYLNVNRDVNFIFLLNQETESYIYVGNHSMTTNDFTQLCKQAYEQSWQGLDRGTFRILYKYRFFSKEKKDTVTFFQPVYSTQLLDKQIGLLCINVNDTLLGNMQQSANQQSVILSVMDVEGNVLTSTALENEWNGDQLISFEDEEDGIVKQQGKIFFYKKIDGWNVYIVSEIWKSLLYESAVKAVIILVIIMILLMFGSLVIIRGIVNKSYEPLQMVVDAMDEIDENRLTVKIDTSNMGEDFEKLGKGYNRMMDEINSLITKVKDEEKQMSQIRLNALQSQIQPHFLYNTLECIHWQSCVDGNQEASVLVKALARYYRICLSQGKEIVPLSTELEHIQYYLLIQNKRFGDVVKCEVQVSEEFMQKKMPKITLQPLVENCIYHGIKIKEGFRGIVIISARKVNDDYIVEVSDNGTGMTKEKIAELNASISDFQESPGYGVKNVNKRIELLFGSKYGLTYKSNKTGGLTVEILLPLDCGEEKESMYGGYDSV